MQSFSESTSKVLETLSPIIEGDMSDGLSHLQSFVQAALKFLPAKQPDNDYGIEIRLHLGYDIEQPFGQPASAGILELVADHLASWALTPLCLKAKSDHERVIRFRNRDELEVLTTEFQKQRGVELFPDSKIILENLRSGACIAVGDGCQCLACILVASEREHGILKAHEEYLQELARKASGAFFHLVEAQRRQLLICGQNMDHVIGHFRYDDLGENPVAPEILAKKFWKYIVDKGAEIFQSEDFECHTTRSMNDLRPLWILKPGERKALWEKQDCALKFEDHAMNFVQPDEITPILDEKKCGLTTFVAIKNEILNITGQRRYHHPYFSGFRPLYLQNYEKKELSSLLAAPVVIDDVPVAVLKAVNKKPSRGETGSIFEDDIAEKNSGFTDNDQVMIHHLARMVSTYLRDLYKQSIALQHLDESRKKNEQLCNIVNWSLDFERVLPQRSKNIFRQNSLDSLTGEVAKLVGADIATLCIAERPRENHRLITKIIYNWHCLRGKETEQKEKEKEKILGTAQYGTRWWIAKSGMPFHCADLREIWNRRAGELDKERFGDLTSNDVIEFLGLPFGKLEGDDPWGTLLLYKKKNISVIKDLTMNIQSKEAQVVLSKYLSSLISRIYRRAARIERVVRQVQMDEIWSELVQCVTSPNAINKHLSCVKWNDALRVIAKNTSADSAVLYTTFESKPVHRVRLAEAVSDSWTDEDDRIVLELVEDVVVQKKNLCRRISDTRISPDKGMVGLCLALEENTFPLGVLVFRTTSFDEWLENDGSFKQTSFRKRLVRDLALLLNNYGLLKQWEDVDSAVLVTDGHGIIRSINPSTLRLFKFSKETDLIGKPISKFYRRKETQAEEIRKLVSQNKIQDGAYHCTVEVEFIDGQNNPIWAQLSVTGYPDENNQRHNKPYPRFYGFLGVAIVISDIKQHLRLLGENLNEVGIGFMITDADQRLQGANETLRNWFESKENFWLKAGSCRCHQTFGRDNDSYCKQSGCTSEAAKHREQVFSHQLASKDTEGKDRHFWILSFPVAKATSFFKIVIDIDKYYELGDFRSKLTNAIFGTHILKNWFSEISSTFDIIGNIKQGESAETGLLPAELQKLKNRSKFLNGIFQWLVDKQDLKIDKVHLDAILPDLDNYLEPFREHLKRENQNGRSLISNIDFEYDAPHFGGQLSPIYVCETDIYMIIYELLENARQYSKDSQIKKVKFIYGQKENLVFLRYEDDGFNFPDEVVKYLEFDPNAKLKSGLSIVRSLAKRNYATINMNPKSDDQWKKIEFRFKPAR